MAGILAIACWYILFWMLMRITRLARALNLRSNRA
jgi:uncharacterized membrane protein